MTEIEFDQFIKLVELDREISQLYNDQNFALKLIEEAEIVLRSKYQELDELKKQVHNLRKQVDSLELEIKTFDMQEKEKKERIGQASTTKEYYSLEYEIEEIKRRRAKLEEELFKIWTELEEIQMKFNNLNTVVLEKEELTVKELSKLKERVAYLERQINQLSSLRPNYISKVPEDLLNQYNIMKESVTYPVVPVTSGLGSQIHCSACFFVITQQDYNLLKQHQLVRCKDCYRLLYLPHKIGAGHGET